MPRTFISITNASEFWFARFRGRRRRRPPSLRAKRSNPPAEEEWIASSHSLPAQPFTLRRQRDTLPHSRGAMRPSGANPSPRKQRAQCTQRAQGKPGARCTRSLACEMVESTRVSHHRFTGTPGLPCAMVLTVSFALSPVTGLFCHRRKRDAKHHRQLDASVGASGPHDFAVRRERHSSGALFARLTLPRPSHPAANVRDDRETPLYGCGMAVDVEVILGQK